MCSKHILRRQIAEVNQGCNICAEACEVCLPPIGCLECGGQYSSEELLPLLEGRLGDVLTNGWRCPQCGSSPCTACGCHVGYGVEHSPAVIAGAGAGGAAIPEAAAAAAGERRGRCDEEADAVRNHVRWRSPRWRHYRLPVPHVPKQSRQHGD